VRPQVRPPRWRPEAKDRVGIGVDGAPTPMPRPMSAWALVPPLPSRTATTRNRDDTAPAAHMTIMNEQQKVPDWLVVDACVAEIHPFVPHRFDAVLSTVAKVTEHEVTLSNEVVYPVPGLRRTQGEDTFVLMSVSDPQVLRVRLAHTVWEQRAAVVEKYEAWSAEPTELNSRALENAARLAAFSQRNFAGWLSARAEEEVAKEAAGPV